MDTSLKATMGEQGSQETTPHLGLTTGAKIGHLSDVGVVMQSDSNSKNRNPSQTELRCVFTFYRIYRYIFLIFNIYIY